ncbi:MAG: hypothetical protein PWP08_1537 [Methanofollis sp.]|nr:hypothetical protein [Methanofollis sp.]
MPRENQKKSSPSEKGTSTARETAPVKKSTKSNRL